MNNERYLFRGKRIDNGKFEFGDLIQIGDEVLISGPEMWAVKMTESVELEHAAVFPETVGQFTTVEDSNGVKLFEGDIIRSFDSKGNAIMHTVVYDKEESRFAIMVENASQFDTPMRLTQRWVTEFDKQVIGNIHTTNK